MSYDDTEGRLSSALQGIVGDRPYAPDLDRIESRGRKIKHRRMAWRATAGTSFAVAAVAAIAVATSSAGSHNPPADLAGPSPATSGSSTRETPLVRLVGYLSTASQPKGDATLLLRDQVYDDGLKVDVWDLHADNGDYYFSKTKAGLPTQVSGHHNRGGEDQDGRKKVVAAAKYAATGDLDEGRAKMFAAYTPKNPKVERSMQAPGVTPSLPAGAAEKLPKDLRDFGGINSTDNWVWNNSMEALQVGAGNPTVRAGVLRLLGQMPEVKVEQGTLKGQKVLILTADKPAVTSPESVTIDAGTGLPLRYTGDGVTVNYTVTRVTLAGVAQGKF
jgi:hypothetical protein